MMDMRESFKWAVREMLACGEFGRLANFNEFDAERIRKLEGALRELEESDFETSMGAGIMGMPFPALIAAFSDAEPVLADVLCFMAAADAQEA